MVRASRSHRGGYRFESYTVHIMRFNEFSAGARGEAPSEAESRESRQDVHSHLFAYSHLW